MATLNFHRVDTPEQEAPEDYDDQGCQCPPGDDKYLLEIDEGRATLVHAACGKTPPYQWGDWEDLVYMNPIPVTVKWESNCDGSMWHGEHRCDCDAWVQATASGASLHDLPAEQQVTRILGATEI